MAGTLSGDGELFKASGAQLYVLMEGGDSVPMQSGKFALMLVKNPVSQLAAVVAMVGEVQWPVGRDSNVVRGDEGSFTFTLPGSLTYKLVLTSSTSADLRKLEHILQEYSDCQKRPAEQQSQQNADLRKGKEAEQPEQPALASDSRKRAIDITGSQLTRRMLRARRMSAVAKVFSKSLERGAINAANHVEPMDIAASLQQIPPRLALASVDAVARVVDAVETGGRLLESAASVAAGVAVSQGQKDRQGSAAGTSSDSTLHMLIKSGWTLNNLGLLMLFRVISASMAIHSGGSSSGGSSRSGSSSSSEFHRLLSSSSSSSSFSSKSPATPSHAQGGGTADVTSSALSPPVVATTMPSSLPVPPPPPLFSHNTPRVRHRNMPPPSGPILPMAGPPSQTVIASNDSQGSTPFRIYKPRPTPAAPTTIAPSAPPCVPRPPRFHHPPKG